jgi:dienelactone hydrolase
MTATGAADYNILQNNGKPAHQFVPHVHFHIIPKPGSGGGLGVGWSASAPIKDGVGAALSAKIRAALETDTSQKKSCCPPGSHPALVEDTSRTLSGAVESVEVQGSSEPMDVYYTSPSGPATDTARGVLVVYDVHGFNGGRIKGACDELAARGLHVAMADVYGGGRGVNDLGGFGSDSGKDWLRTFGFGALEPKLDAAIALLRRKGSKRIGALGFCWGGWVVAHLSAAGKIAAGASAHPSTCCAEILYGESELGLVSSVTTPMLLMPAGNDPENLKEGGAVVAAIRKAGQHCETRVFKDMKHGWVPRGDAADPAVARDVEAALRRAAEFFHEKL